MPVKFVEGWNIGNPDAILEMPKDFVVHKTGMMDYQYVILPTNFTEDNWMVGQPIGVLFTPKRDKRLRGNGNAVQGV